MNVMKRASIATWVLAGWLLTEATPCLAQSPEKIYTRETSFRMPIEIAPAERQSLQEIRLFVQGTDHPSWKLVASGPAEQESFHFKAARDGEYHFGFVTVSKDGSAYPLDLDSVPPVVTIVVDTTTPTVDLKAQKTANGDLFLRVDVDDSNPDLQATAVEYRDATGHWRALPRYRGEFFQVTHPKIAEAMVRVKARDMAGNEVVSEIRLDQAEVVKQSTSSKQTSPANPTRPTVIHRMPSPNDPPPYDVGRPVVLKPEIEQVSSRKVDPPEPVETFTQEATRTPDLPPPELPSIPELVATPNPIPQLWPEPKTARSESKLPRIEATMIGSTQFALDYAVESLKLSPGSRIEFWYTTDMGASWKLMGVDTDRQSPAHLKLPGDGLYGVIARVNEKGTASTPPQDQKPEFWLEVDATPPVVKLGEPIKGTGDEVGSLHIAWTAVDRNLTTEPITLYYAEHASGPWKPIAESLKNTGIYRWQPDAEVGSSVYVRIRVEDMAGNVSRSDSPKPIKLK